MLASVFAGTWDYLMAGTGDGRPPFKTMQAATIGLDGSPNVRTVVLRKVSEQQNVITFHTDLRSPKIAELTRDPRIALVGVDAERNVQIRVSGRTRIVRDEHMRMAAWNASRLQTLIVYRTLLAPGTEIEQPRDAFDEARQPHGPNEGFENFCVVEVEPLMIDWLDLSAAGGHERARFQRVDDAWDSHWVAP